MPAAHDDGAAASLRVEFLGLPGVGKSTLSHRVAAHLAAAGRLVSQSSYELAHDVGPGPRRWRKSIHVIAELLRHPIAAWRAARAVQRTTQPDLSTRLRLWFNWLLVLDLGRAASRRQGVHLFDQGILQAIWSIALEDRDEAALSLLAAPAARSALPDLVVVVDADLDVVAKRLDRRQGRDSRVERTRNGISLLQRGDQLVAAIRKQVRRDHAIEVVEARTDEADLEQLAARIAARLQERTRPLLADAVAT